jgi:[ribosomal protein S5]-alanine N-acetyltransferase
MSAFPVIETDRLLLRQLRSSDSADVFHYFSMDEVTKYYDLESFTAVEQAEQLIEKFNQRFENNQGYRWGITLKAEDRVIGSCGFHSWEKRHFRAEIGYELSPEYWRKGIMAEVLRAVLQYGFSQLEINRIQAFIDRDNVSSRKLLEKAGFKEEGTLKDYFFEKNRFVDAVIFSVVQREHSN